MGPTRWAVASLWALPVECAFPPGPPEAASSPRAVAIESRGRRVLLDVDLDARAQGVRPGQTETEAKARCPELVVRPRREAREQARLETIAEAALAFGPEVEVQPPGFVALEIARSRAALAARAGRDHLDDVTLGEALQRRIERLGHRARVVIADELDTARTLAAWRGPELGVEVIEPGRSVAVLSSLPLAALAWSDAREDPEGRFAAKLEEAVDVLEALGFHRVGDLLALEGHPLPARLEDAGPFLVRRARAEGRRPLRVHEPVSRIVESFELDRGTEDLEPLLFILRRLVAGVAARLQGRGQSTASVRLGWTYEPGLEHAIEHDAIRPRSSRRTEHIDVPLARPTRNEVVLFDVLKESLRVPGFVRHLSLEANAVAPDLGVQLDLFSRHPQKLEAAAALVSRLRARLGPEAVFTPRVRDVHRPEAAWRVEAFDIDRALAEPHSERPRPAPLAIERLPWEEEVSSDRALPAVDEKLSVTGTPEALSDPADVPRGRPKGAWPKPVPRRGRDEPAPPLPPRPTRLLPHPEQVRCDGERLEVRGQTLRLIERTHFERLETEWWTAAPVQRDYWVGQADDGRRLWLFEDADRRTHLHGWFD